ncbi:Protein CBG16975 [Caenorhabditis briggsae]|uniref:Protein CBG16975 n=1 Tax=Caenorhabditis briggsae TaxID=6238 RepID=E3CU59_CAEBR|nr:Protein CBG16975 [Caenorhabditis briggsae]CBX32982.1 Protein CBG16975 [Caenorhabditis briggsae]
MNSTCNPDVGYFDSPKFLSLVLHINTIISTPIYLFGFYCIIWKTPVIMKSAKLYLLNLHIWIVSFDYSISILAIPLLLAPHYAGYPLGVLSWFDVSVLFQTAMVFFFIANMVASIVVIFESRFYTVCEFSWKPYWKRWRKTGVIFYHVVQSCVILALVFFAFDQETVKRNLFAQLPCLPQYIYDANIFVLCDKETYRMLFLLIAIILASVMVVSFAILLVWNILVPVRSRIMSQNTFQLQKSFLIALGVQIVVLLCTIVIPVAYAEISIVFNYYNQSFTNFAVCLFRSIFFRQVSDKFGNFGRCKTDLD